MMLCRDCGQNSHLSDENFIAYRAISGTETLYIDPDDCDNIVDYGESNTDSEGIDEYVCPHCDGNNVDTGWEDDDDEITHAQGLRNSYDRRLLVAIRKRENEQQKNERWDK